MPKKYIFHNNSVEKVWTNRKKKLSYKVMASICANLRLDLYLKIKKFVVKLFFLENFCFIY